LPQQIIFKMKIKVKAHYRKGRKVRSHLRSGRTDPISKDYPKKKNKYSRQDVEDVVPFQKSDFMYE